VASFKKSGFLPVDQIQVAQIDAETFKVIEGNRRIATLKFLKEEYEKRGNDIGNLNPEIFDNIPVVYYEGTTVKSVGRCFPNSIELDLCRGVPFWSPNAVYLLHFGRPQRYAPT